MGLRDKRAHATGIQRIDDNTMVTANTDAVTFIPSPNKGIKRSSTSKTASCYLLVGEILAVNFVVSAVIFQRLQRLVQCFL